MIFNGTSKELADLTRPFWAADWWPDGLDCAGITATCNGKATEHDVLWCLRSPDFAIDEADEEGEEWKRDAIPADDRVEQAVLPMSVEHVAAIIFAAAWSHLIPDRHSSATIEHGACGEFGVIHNGQFVKWCLSPLHAVIAAVSRMGVSNSTR